jgi:zinc transport system ATP-binding protein
MHEPIVEFQNVSFSYGSRVALQHVNAVINKGDYIGLIGPNGAGKTTLIRVLLGLLKPSSGNVRLYGKNIKEFKDWHKIGYVQQKATTFDATFPVTVEEVVAMGRFAFAGVGRPLDHHDRHRIGDVLKMVGLDKVADRRVGELSGGQQQKVFIARALASDPDLLILDEPTTGVDVRSQHEFYHFLHDLNVHHRLTLVLISHDTDVVSTHVSRLLCINKTIMDHGCSIEFLLPSHKHNDVKKNEQIFKRVRHKH